MIDYARLNTFASTRHQSGRRGAADGRRRWLLAAVVIVAAAGLGGALLWWYLAPSVSVTGLADGDHVTPEQLGDTTVAIDVSGAGSPTLRINGQRTSATERDGTLIWEPPQLDDGVHELTVSAPRRVVGSVSTTIEFTVDGSPPRIDLLQPEPASIGSATTLEGRTDPQATVELDTAGGHFETVADDRGRFALDVDHPPVGRLTVTDRAGNTAWQRIVTPVEHPGSVAVHVASTAWADPEKKASFLRLIDERRIDTVQLDLKDERGAVGYDSDVPLAGDIGAVHADYVLADALAELHELDVRVVGRIVAFRDPILADAAWSRGDNDWVLQTPEGDRFPAYDGSFVNYAHPRVRQYNLALAAEAAEAGVDEIMWDYIRRPEGSPESMVVPGRGDRPSSEHIVSFLAEAHRRVRPAGALHSAAVFGIAADRGDTVAQNIPAMARHVEVLAPMVYPSHWNRGEYGVDNPDHQPYDIVRATVALFVAELGESDETGTEIQPWIQDFNSSIEYGPAEVRAQVDATRDAGGTGVFLWNPNSEYSPGGLHPIDS